MLSPGVKVFTHWMTTSPPSVHEVTRCAYSRWIYRHAVREQHRDSFAHREALEILYICMLFTTLTETEYRRERRDTQSAESLITMLLAVIFSAAVMEVKSSRCRVKSCDESYPQINTSRATCRLYHDNNPITCACVRPVSCFREILNHNEQHWLLILTRVSTLLFVFLFAKLWVEGLKVRYVRFCHLSISFSKHTECSTPSANCCRLYSVCPWL